MSTNYTQQNKKRGKVFVGLSGGVDSSVSAALLKEQGFDVTGVFIKTWHPDFLPCTWRDERRDAMRVAARLEIPFMTFDFEKEYKKEVVDYLIEEYKRGLTPNPDVMCNKQIKFGSFFNKAREMGANYIATGHYAEVKKNSDQCMLLAGIDKEKDQSYFLWTITQEKLSRTLFPVGNIAKTETRRLAKKFGLATAEKKDSQGICFLGNVSMKDFLKNFMKEKEGTVLDTSGKIIGTHPGAFFFTIGERHGFTVTEKGTDDPVYYVVSKDLQKNTITVSHELIETSGASESFVLSNANWISGQALDDRKKINARVRYRQELQKCKIISTTKNKTEVLFDLPQTAAAGQSIVFYLGRECLGGGIIDK